MLLALVILDDVDRAVRVSKPRSLDLAAHAFDELLDSRLDRARENDVAGGAGRLRWWASRRSTISCTRSVSRRRDQEDQVLWVRSPRWLLVPRATTFSASTASASRPWASSRRTNASRRCPSSTGSISGPNPVINAVPPELGEPGLDFATGDAEPTGDPATPVRGRVRSSADQAEVESVHWTGQSGSDSGKLGAGTGQSGRSVTRAFGQTASSGCCTEEYVRGRQLYRPLRATATEVTVHLSDGHPGAADPGDRERRNDRSLDSGLAWDAGRAGSARGLHRGRAGGVARGLPGARAEARAARRP